MLVPNDYSDRSVCIIGLGYVGLTLAVVMAEAGFKVYGVERNKTIVDLVNSGRAHFLEAGLDARLAVQASKQNVMAFTDLSDVPETSVYIITVGTPLSHDAKTTNLAAIEVVARAVGDRLKDGDLIILRSTVRIGVSRTVVKPILDATGAKYDLAFCPERTLEGKALMELVSLPQIVGGIDDAASLRAGQVFGFLTPTIIRVSSLEVAETVKLVNNTQRDLMFAFANEIAGYCDAVGISAKEVIQSANMGYARSTLAMPGPVGGPCLEKDPYILAEGVHECNGIAELALLGRSINENLPRDTAEYLAGLVRANGLNTEGLKVTIAGLAFKGRPETSDLRGTLAIPLIAELKAHLPGADIIGYDPACKDEELSSLGIDIVNSAEDAFDNAGVVLFQNNNPSFEKLDLNRLAQRMKSNSVIYDLWAQFDTNAIDMPQGVVYGGLGLRHRYAR